MEVTVHEHQQNAIDGNVCQCADQDLDAGVSNLVKKSTDEPDESDKQVRLAAAEGSMDEDDIE